MKANLKDGSRKQRTDLRGAQPVALSLLLLLALPSFAHAQFNYETNEGTITIAGYTGPGGDITIPSVIDDLPVTAIADRAFDGCRSLTSIIIPESVTSIGAYAFAWCTSLTNVTIPDSVTKIGGSAFKDCTSLTSVTIPNDVTLIAQETFYYCNSLTSITIGKSLTRIEYCAFFCCTRLSGVYFRGNAPSVDPTAFDYATLAIVYHLPGTSGWGSSGALWFLPNPMILSDNSSFGMRTNGFGFIISWATNIPVVVEACASLSNPVWAPVATNTLTDGTSDFNDPDCSNYPARFYRLRSP